MPALLTGTTFAEFTSTFSSREQNILASVTPQGVGISWFNCPDSNKTQCAFFNVPRDYSEPSDDDTVSIFMRKFPAQVSDNERLGSILVNPGGPGGSGNLFVALLGEELGSLVDGKYDIIGFDPRGVNLTGPWTGCFDTEAKPMWTQLQLQFQGVPYPRATFSSDQNLVNKISALQAGHNAACLKYGNRKMLESTGTASVVQDMVKIVEALGEDGLNYWGFSYGTILGATFAAMRPDLVKRMVLDGVSNAESYFDNLWQWGRDGIKESHKTFTGFLTTCAEAGPKHCAFAIPPDNSNVVQTTEHLRKRLDNIFTQLGKLPIVVVDSPIGPGLFTASDLQKLLLGVLYAPVAWNGAMQLLAMVEKGDATIAYTALYMLLLNVDHEPYNKNVFNRSMQHQLASRESLHSILCADTAVTNVSASTYTNYFRELGDISPVGEQWAHILGACNGWSFQANQRYSGPWSTKDGLKKTSLDADPVTPLSSALKMSSGFGLESATLLIQQGFGHCTTAHPSLCTYKNVRDYFVDGKVPLNGTYCTPEPGFIYPANDLTLMTVKSEEEEKVLGALRKLGRIRKSFDLKAPEL
ncbi:alpha/beta hydrolase family protein [Ceratobasidium sp. AG-Ba]|nr:alpha/beta hydrolase family protein [Ceratobasidium sp. AG-Ba]